MSKTILCTGGAGFIGSHLVDKLIGLGHKVIIFDNLSTGSVKNINKHATFVRGDISYKFASNYRESILNAIIKHKPDCVFHLAAQINLRKSIENPISDAEENIIGSLNVIEACKVAGVKRFIFSSTGGAIYDPDTWDEYKKTGWIEESPTKPASPYGVAKLSIEHYLRISGLDYTILRYSNVYGPRQSAEGEAGVISIFIDRLMNDKELIIFGDGAQTRDFIYVDDVINANIFALYRPQATIKETYNISVGIESTINHVADLIKMIMNKQSNAILHRNNIPGELRYCSLNHAKLISHSDGKWAPHTTLLDGLVNTIKYYTENK